ncbi:hypothetical protein G9A89_015521 [Geosiphon pyriformis]|nr:hypothetical protein G9A89_015521 [Geosiphon pyriformis]
MTATSTNIRQSLGPSTMNEVAPLLKNTQKQDSCITVTVEDGTKGYEAIVNMSEEQIPMAKAARRWKTILALSQLIMLFALSLGLVYLVIHLFLPPIDLEDRALLKLPKNFEQLQALNQLLSSYMEQSYFNVMNAFIIVYIFLQTFSIPGSMWLSVLGGALFGLPVALIIVCTCSAIGATNCYLISQRFGKTFVKERFSEKLDLLASHLQNHSNHLLNYLIVLRLVPFPPNWFANIAAPHVGIPLKIFLLGTFFGVAGPSVIHVQAGLTINQMTSASDFHMFSWANVGALVLIGLGVLIPVFLKSRVQQKIKLTDESLSSTSSTDGLLSSVSSNRV